MFQSGVINLQLAVCAEEFGIHDTYIIPMNRGTTTTAVCTARKDVSSLTSRVTVQTAIDSASVLASSVR